MLDLISIAETIWHAPYRRIADLEVKNAGKQEYKRSIVYIGLDFVTKLPCFKLPKCVV